MELSNDPTYRRALLARKIPEQRKKVEELQAEIGRLEDEGKKALQRAEEKAAIRTRPSGALGGFLGTWKMLFTDPLGTEQLGVVAELGIFVKQVQELQEQLEEERQRLHEMEAEHETLSQRRDGSTTDAVSDPEDERQRQRAASKRMQDIEHEIFETEVLPTEKDIRSKVAKREMRGKILRHTGLSDEEREDLLDRLEKRFGANGPDIYEGT